MLDREARRELLTLSKANGADVARHLVMAGILLADDPETAYLHAQAAGRGAGRVAVAREGVAITSYATGRYAEALKELRAVRRLSGRDEHRVMEADCERGLGRPERALQVIAGVDTTELSDADRAELAIVASGARSDLGEHEAGLLLLRTVQLDAIVEPSIRARLDQVIADRLDELGRADEATAIRRAAPVEALGSDLEFDVIDLHPEDEFSSPDDESSSGSAGRSTGSSHGAADNASADAAGSDPESPAEAAPSDSASNTGERDVADADEESVPAPETDTEETEQSLPAEDHQAVGSDETAQSSSLEDDLPAVPVEPELSRDGARVDDAQEAPATVDDVEEPTTDVTDDDGQLELDLFARDAPAQGDASSTDEPPAEPRTGTMSS